LGATPGAQTENPAAGSARSRAGARSPRRSCSCRA